MSQFSYSFCLSLFHSLWQSALLLALYTAIQPIIKKQPPSFKRNILYGLLFTQLIISCITFLIYYSGSFNFYREIIEVNVPLLLGKQPFIEKISPWIFYLYASVTSFKSIHLIYKWYRFKQLCHTTFIKPPVHLRLFTQQKANEFGIPRRVTLWISSIVSTPITFGFLKPVILMPVALLSHLSVEEAESLIIHELTHIKNNDYLLNWLLVVAETIFFFNPLIKIISCKIKLEREKNCDVQVLQFQYPVVSYAETLLKTAKFKTSIHFFSLAAVFKNKQLIQRIRFFTTGENLVFSKNNYGSIPFSAIVIAVFINLFILAQLRNNKTVEHPVVFFPQTAKLNSDHISPSVQAAFSSPAYISTPQPVKKEDEQAAALNKQFNSINANVKIASEKAVELEAQAEKLALETNYTIQAANIETEVKDLIVNEEISGTNEAVTRAYKLKLKNGQWKKELLYIIKEGKAINDSIINVKDSVSYIPAMQ